MKLVKMTISFVVMITVIVAMSVSTIATTVISSSVYFTDTVYDDAFPLGVYSCDFSASDLDIYSYVEYDIRIAPPPGSSSSNPRSGLGLKVKRLFDSYDSIIYDYLNSASSLTLDQYFISRANTTTEYSTLINYPLLMSSNGDIYANSIYFIKNKVYFYDILFESARSTTFYGEREVDLVCGSPNNFLMFSYYYN